MGCGQSSNVDQLQKSDSPNLLLKENNGEFKNDYSLKEKVGEGTYGIVRKVKHRKTGEERVVKRILKTSLRQEELINKMANDVLFLRKIDHPNVIKPFEFYQDDQYFWIVTEFISGGDLIRRLEQKGLLTEKETSNILKQVLSVLNWCHKHNIMHRDLKPENIMIETNSKKELGYQIKVIDWGTAKSFRKGEKVTELLGTPYYIAPEVVAKDKSYNEKCDLWSLGAMMYTILSGDPPFYSEDIHHILQMVEKGDWQFEGEIWDTAKGGISEEAKDLITKLMTKDPKKRISAEEALKHEWFNKAPENKISDEQKNNYIQKLHKFNGKNKLQQAALMFITQQCTQKAERDQLAKAFSAIDQNKDGTLSKNEIIQYFKESMTEEQAEQECEQMIQRVDVDNNGLINYSEFLMATHQLQVESQKEYLRESFDYFDGDKNGYITVEELQKILGDDMKSNNENAWNDIMKETDKNKDGQISFEEFCQMMAKMAEQTQ